MPLTSIIIVNHNRASEITRCLDSIARLSDPQAYEVIIVDNFSSLSDFNRLSEVVLSLRQQGATNGRARLIRNKHNQGFGAANNVGAACAQGDYLFFLNPDTYLLNDALGEFVSFMESPGARSAGAAGCLLEDSDGNENHSYGDFQSMKVSAFLFRELLRPARTVFRTMFPRRPRRLIKRSHTLALPLRVGWITGADLFVRRKAFFDAGGFDSRIFLYSEEVDLQRRLRSRGWSRWILAGPRIAHTHGRYDAMSNSARIHFVLGLFIYFAIWEPGWILLGAFVVYKACCVCIAMNEIVAGECTLTESFEFMRKFRLADIRSARGGGATGVDSPPAFRL